MDDGLAQALLAPYVVVSDPSHGFVSIQAGDGGEADVYANPGRVMIDHFAPGGILDIVAGLAERLGAVILLPEGAAMVGSAEDRAHLPVELQTEAVVVDLSGAAI